MLTRISTLLSAAWLLSSVAVANTPWTQPRLLACVRESLDNGLVQQRPPRIIYGRTSIQYDLGSVDYDAYLGQWQAPFDAQFRVELIRRYRSAPNQRQSWSPYLARAEALIGQQIDWINQQEQIQAPLPEPPALPAPPASFRNQPVDADQESRLDQLNGEIDAILVSHIEQSATSRGLTARPLRSHKRLRVEFERQDQAQQPPAVESQSPQYWMPDSRQNRAWRVEIRVSPAGASVYYLPEFQFRVMQYYKKELLDDLTEWRQVFGSAVELTGNYRFVARWNRTGKTVRTSKVAITRGQTLVLRPNQ
jgi:hypothetical protein